MQAFLELRQILLDLCAQTSRGPRGCRGGWGVSKATNRTGATLCWLGTSR
jgi:hypothetical protein